MTLKDREQEIIENFEIYDDWMDKYQYLVDLGNSLPPLADSEKTNDKLIKGCQSNVWLICEEKDGILHFRADSDAIIVKGIISLLIKVLSGTSAEELASAEISFIEKIGLKEHLSPTRSNGLLAMLSQMKYYAMAYKMRHNGQIV